MKQTKKPHIFCACIFLIDLGNICCFFLSKTPGFESLQFGVINWVAKFFSVLNFLTITN